MFNLIIEAFRVSRSGLRVKILQTKLGSARPATRDPKHATKERTQHGQAGTNYHKGTKTQRKPSVTFHLCVLVSWWRKYFATESIKIAIKQLIVLLLEGVLFHHLHDIKLSVFKNKPLGRGGLTAIKCDDNRLFKPP